MFTNNIDKHLIAKLKSNPFHTFLCHVPVQRTRVLTRTHICISLQNVNWSPVHSFSNLSTPANEEQPLEVTSANWDTPAELDLGLHCRLVQLRIELKGITYIQVTSHNGICVSMYVSIPYIYIHQRARILRTTDTSYYSICFHVLIH